MNQYDIIGYYNILDNTFWTTVDLGLDVKILDTSYTVNPLGVFTGYNDNSTTAIPMAYARARFEIPTTDIGLETDVKYINYDGNSYIDTRAKIDYTIGITPVFQPGVEVGYRYQNFDLNNDNLKSKIKFYGLYAGLIVRF